MDKCNISLEHQSLEELIKKIQNNIDDINIVYNNNSNIIKKLDNNWIGPNKRKFDEEYYPYIKNLNKYFLENVTNCLNLLIDANNSYQNTNLNIENSVSDLES